MYDVLKKVQYSFEEVNNMLGWEAIWLDYLEVDNKTLETYLSEDAPEDVKEAYAEYMEDIKYRIEHDLPIFI